MEAVDEKSRKMNVFATGSAIVDEISSADIDIFGTAIVKPGYLEALKVCSRLSEYIDYCEYQGRIAEISESTIDDIKLKDVDADTAAKVKDILQKTVKLFGHMYVMRGDIDYSAALISLKECKNPDGCSVYDKTVMWGLQLMAVAFATATEKGTNIDMTAELDGESHTYHILGNGMFEASKSVQYNLNKGSDGYGK